MAYFDGTANYIVFQFLKKTAQRQSLQASDVCQTKDESDALRERMLQALANWILKKVRFSLFLRPNDTLSAKKSETSIRFSDGGAGALEISLDIECAFECRHFYGVCHYTLCLELAWTGEHARQFRC